MRLETIRPPCGRFFCTSRRASPPLGFGSHHFRLLFVRFTRSKGLKRSPRPCFWYTRPEVNRSPRSSPRSILGEFRPEVKKIINNYQYFRAFQRQKNAFRPRPEVAGNTSRHFFAPGFEGQTRGQDGGRSPFSCFPLIKL